MAGWAPYVNLLMGNKAGVEPNRAATNVQTAALYGHDGAKWALEKSWVNTVLGVNAETKETTKMEKEPSKEEVVALVAGCKDAAKDERKNVFAVGNGKDGSAGIRVGGSKFMFTSVMDVDGFKVVVGKCKQTTILLVLTAKALVIVLATKECQNVGNITTHLFVAKDLKGKKF